jgi:hypothetical protein
MPYVQALMAYDSGSGPALYAGGSFLVAGASADSFLGKWGGCPAPPPPWTDLGFALPGTFGAPLLVGMPSASAG